LRETQLYIHRSCRDGVTTRRGEKVAEKGGRPSWWRTEEHRRGRGRDALQKKGQEPLTNYATSSQLHKPAPGYLYATRLPISGLTSTWLTTVHCRFFGSFFEISRSTITTSSLSLSFPSFFFFFLLLLFQSSGLAFFYYSFRVLFNFTSSSLRWWMCNHQGVVAPVDSRIFSCVPSNVRGLEMWGSIHWSALRKMSGWINWNFDRKWINLNFSDYKSTKFLIEITDIIRIFWVIYFQIFFSEWQLTMTGRWTCVHWINL